MKITPKEVNSVVLDLEFKYNKPRDNKRYL